jgi:signal transduction histidine kinase
MDREMVAGQLARTAGELRMELARISMASEMLERTSTDQDHLAMIEQGIYRILRIANRLELAHRLTDDNEVRVFPEPMEVETWAQKLGEHIQGVLAERNVKFTYTVEPDIYGAADQELLDNMVLELVDNAANSGNLVTMAVTGDENGMEISVTGDGLQDIVRRLSRRRSEIVEGGLGQSVALAERIAALHGGSLVVGGNSYQGATVAAVVPFRKMPVTRRVKCQQPAWDTGGFDPVLVGLSNLLPASAFQLNRLE